MSAPYLLLGSSGVENGLLAGSNEAKRVDSLVAGCVGWVEALCGVAEMLAASSAVSKARGNLISVPLDRDALALSRDRCVRSCTVDSRLRRVAARFRGSTTAVYAISS